MMGASSSDDLALGQPHIWGLHSARLEVSPEDLVTYLAREQGRCESQELR